MRVPGKIIRAKRLSRHLTQSQLASGICTQATVSLIENRNRCPNWLILRQIFERLQVPLTLLQNQSRSLRLARSINMILSGTTSGLTDVLHLIDYRQFDRNIEKCQYFCCQAWLDLSKNRLMDSIHYFTRVLTLKTHYNVDLYQAWANYGLGQINYRLKRQKRVADYVKKAYGLVEFDESIKSGSSLDFYLNILLRINIMKLWLQIKNLDRLFVVARETIQYLIHYHSMYKLSVIYMLTAQAYHYSNQHVKALRLLKRAQIFSQIYQDKEMFNSVTDLYQWILRFQKRGSDNRSSLLK